MANRLSGEKSPYLLQHADNPVDWYPWGEEAFRKAEEEGKPVFLSIGYATCHWCHVMERESFEDGEVSGLLNTHFVSVKVDREERSDIDHIYMTVCQALTGRGGWPLSIFMTSERKPFFAGTYFPKTGRLGLTGFTELLQQIAHLWQYDRNRLLNASEEILSALRSTKGPGGSQMLTRDTLENAFLQLRQAFDPQWGGFGHAPKFPTPHHLTFLLRWHRRNPLSEAAAMVGKTLESMRFGGMFDQFGFGFHRYSVDERWMVPHFEKMLYDQAMLAMAYTEAFQATGEERFARVVREIFEYVLRDMTSPEGGFYSAEDADSEGEEGRFYVWTPREVVELLGRDLGDLVCRFYDISPEGDFEHGKSIPHITKPAALFARVVGMDQEELEALLEKGRQELLFAREKRVHPLKDDKVLTAWNGLMIAALAKGYQALGAPDYLDAAVHAADFLLGTLRTDSGRIYRRYRHGSVAHPACLDDYAFLTWGLIELYESAFHVPYLEEAVRITRSTLDLFGDAGEGGFFYTAHDSEKLILQNKEIYDGAIPSGSSVALLNLLRLGRITGNVEWENQAERLMAASSAQIGQHPSGYTQFLNGLDFAVGPTREVVVAGDRDHPTTRKMIRFLHGKFEPNRVMILREPGELGSSLVALCGFAEALRPIDGRPAVYVCEDYRCNRPLTDVEDL